VLALALKPSLVWLLVLGWGYLALTTREFLPPAETPSSARLLASHMVIIPLIDLYARLRLAPRRSQPAAAGCSGSSSSVT
jgi:hypothetical protein